MSDLHDDSKPLSERLKELPEELKHVQLEQLPPNQPSFLTVVILFAAALIVIFILAIFFLHLDRGKLFRRSRPNPTSQLILPAQPPGPALPTSLSDWPSLDRSTALPTQSMPGFDS